MVQRYDTKYDKMGTHVTWRHILTNPKVVILVESAVFHGIMGRRFPDGGLLRYRK